MASELNPVALDRYITGNYGEDQYGICPCGDEECEGEHEGEHEDTRDPDSMPGGWDYEEPDDFPLEMEYDEGGWD